MLVSKILFVSSITTCAITAAQEEWVESMKAVHAKGGSEKGSVSQIGDSITYTQAFLSGMGGLKKAEEWKTLLTRVNTKLLKERKGAEHSNMSGWTAAQGASKIKDVIAAEKPEIAVIMYGTNDARKKVTVAEFKKQMTAILDACLDAGCVPIISTIPPILNLDARVTELNGVIKTLAKEKKIPLVDFHAEMIARQPNGGWDGTLLGKGDVHPSGGALFDFSESNLKNCGYALRNYITCRAMKEVIEKCF